MLGLRGHKYQQTCHSPGQTNLNSYELIDIMDLLLPLPHILSVANEKYSSRRKKSHPSRHRGVGISTFLKKKKTTHSLQVKGLYHRAGTDHLKRLKIENQLRKWLKRTIVTAEGGSPFWGVREHARQEKFWRFMLQMRPFGAILHHFISFFSPLKIQKLFETMIRQGY